jgi:hypothetical protein
LAISFQFFYSLGMNVLLIQNIIEALQAQRL